MRISACLIAAAALICAGCANRQSAEAARGSAAIGRYGCGSCHTIPGISEAHGLVGPPLTNIRSRVYVAGMLENTPENLARWIHDPKSINDRTAMPNLGVTPRDASDISTYLNSR